MNLLISGNLTALATGLAKTFHREKIRVVIAGEDVGSLDLKVGNRKLDNVITHAVAPTGEFFQEIIAAYKFDAVIYLATREEQLLGTGEKNAGCVLDGLLNVLELAHSKGVEKVFYISSTEIYGSAMDTSEDIDPQPASPNGFTLNTGEQYCKHFSELYGINTIIVRVPFIYGAEEKSSFLYHLLEKCRDNQPITLPGSEYTSCDFLHNEDVADFILRALDEYNAGAQVVNLGSPNPMTFEQLVEEIQKYAPTAQIGYDSARTLFTRPAVVRNARKMYDWIGQDKFSFLLPALVEQVNAVTAPKESLFSRLKIAYTSHHNVFKWIEVLVGALVMVYLNEVSGAQIEFRYVDIRLLYVVLIGSIYGTQVGLVAALLAGLSLLFSWARLDLDWTELVYNVANWLPFAVYLTAGGVTGYMRDRNENESRFHDEQIALVHEKYSMLYEVYNEVCNIKNQFHEQLVGSRDSFGRIFAITQELDTLQEEEVLAKALTILENVMDNRSIAIYSLSQRTNFARLEVNSASLNGKITKSLNLADYPAMLECIAKGEIFHNTAVLPGYPSYFAPIKNGSVVEAAVAIWETRFEQNSLYYYNLFKVLTGLVQSSINRVTLFNDANSEKLYIPSTRILQPQAFKRVLLVRNQMKKDKISEHLLVKVNGFDKLNREHDWESIYAQISRGIRTVDHVGLLEDGNCYILFSQADQKDAITIYNRFEQMGISCELMAEQNGLPPSLMENGGYDQHGAGDLVDNGGLRVAGEPVISTPGEPGNGGAVDLRVADEAPEAGALGGGETLPGEDGPRGAEEH